MRDYSFGFNGKDKESEFNSGAYDFGARILDTRLGRWMSVDGVLKISLSPYSFCRNEVLIMVDPSGHDEHIFFHDYNWYIVNGKYTIFNDGKNDIKVPTADKIIHDGKIEKTYYMAVVSEIKITQTTVICDPKMIVSCEEVQKAEVERNLQSMEVDQEDPLTVSDIEVLGVRKEVDGRTSKTLEITVTKYDKIPINSPMTLSGGDSNCGIKTDTPDIIQTSDVGRIIQSWKSNVGYGPTYPLRIGIEGLKLMMGNENSDVAKFRDASKPGGAFDFKSTLGLKQGTLYDINGKLYNANEAGNYCFGMAAGKCGFLLSEVEYGAQSVLTGGRTKDEPWEVKAYTDGFKESQNK